MKKWQKLLIGEWNWKRPIKSLLFVYFAIFIVAIGFSNKLLFRPPVTNYNIQDANISTIQRTHGEKVALYYFPAAEGQPTLLWSHGNAEDLGVLLDTFHAFEVLGYGILAYDYPGYGLSQGKPNEQSCYEAAEAAYQHLRETLAVPADQIILYGQSVGSGPSVWLASQKECAGLVLVTPFISAFRAATKYPLFPGDKFKNINRIQDLTVPLLVIHGDRDQVVPQWHGKKLHALHNGPKYFLGIQGAGHNDLYALAIFDIHKAMDEFCITHGLSQ